MVKRIFVVDLGEIPASGSLSIWKNIPVAELGRINGRCTEGAQY
jgi:hypothetical protein